MDAVDAEDPFSYEPFTRHDFYRDINQALVTRTVDRLSAQPSQRAPAVVDLGCGTGALTEMVVDAFRERGVPAKISGIEPSASALATAARRLPAAANVRLLQGDVSTIAQLAPLDMVFVANAIHLVPDKDDLLTRIAQALVTDGLLAMNSTFFTGAYPPGTERFYRVWMARALRRLRQTHPQVRLARSDAWAPAIDWRSPEEYELLLQEYGFELLTSAMDDVQMSLRAVQDIGHYSLFIEGAMPGVPLDAGADALGFGAAEAFRELDLEFVPRRWLQLIARRR